MDTRIVLEIDDELRSRLEARAQSNRRSLEEEMMQTLRHGIVPLEDDPTLPCGDRLVRLFSGSGIATPDGFQESIDETFRPSAAPPGQGRSHAS